MTSKFRPRIYVGCNLTHSPEKFKENIKSFKNLLRDKPQYEVLDFLGQGKEFTPEQVFAFDTNCVRICNVFIANVTYPGLGIGAEFGIAVEHRKPIITIAEEGAIVSRFIFGYNSLDHFIYRYKTIEDAAEFCLDKLSQLFPLPTFSGK